MNGSMIINSIMLGAGLAMDAFSVSIADGMIVGGSMAAMSLAIAGTFALFQFIMPLAGWACVHALVFRFSSLQTIISLTGAALLLILGAQMIREQVIKNRAVKTAGAKAGEEAQGALSIRLLLVQGVATSIDALSVGFAIANYAGPEALACSALIGAVTFIFCVVGVQIGRGIGQKVKRYAGIAGGCILIVIAVRILLTDVIGL